MLLIAVYCKEENINVNNPPNFLIYLYVKHNFKRFSYLLFEVVQVMALKFPKIVCFFVIIS